MILLPAIDLLDGACVRLYRGDYATSHRVAADPLDAAKRFLEEGAEWLHVVDLNGAKEGTSVNFRIIEKIAALGAKVETGGGIRTRARAGEVLSCGVSRAVLGSAAAENPELAEECAAEYGEKIAVGADSENGIIRTSGWTKSGGIGYLEFCRDMARRGVKTLVVTDISRDGMLSGVNLEMLKTLKENVPANLVASGGVSSELDIESLAELGIYGAICGKSLYAGTLDLKRALEIAHAR